MRVTAHGTALLWKGMNAIDGDAAPRRENEDEILEIPHSHASLYTVSAA